MVQHVEQHHFMVIVPHSLQRFLERIEIGEKVAEDHDDLAAPDAAGELDQAVGHPSFLDRFNRIQKLGEPDNLGHRIAGGNRSTQRFVEGRQRDAISLADDGMPQRRRKLCGIQQLLLQS